MNFKVFKDLEDKVNECIICSKEARERERAARELLAAVKERIERERKANEDRIAELKRQSQDPTKSDTVKRINEMELKKLEQKTFKATNEEKQAILEEIEKSKKAMLDAKKADTRQAFNYAETELKEIRLQAVGAQGEDFELINRSLDGCEEVLSQI